MSTAVAKQEENAEVAVISPEEQALIDAAKGQIDSSKLILPNLKLTNALTKEVAAGDAESGEFINSLTGEHHGASVDVVIAALFAGRFYSDKETNQSYSARGDVAPSNWPEEYAGQAFVDIPDSEEQWKAASNADEHPWGKGPPISTTSNFVAFVIPWEEGSLPVRISMMRSNNPAANKLKTLIWAAKAPWDRIFTLKAVGTVSNGRPYFVIDVSQSGVTPPDARQAAVHLAQDFATREVELAGSDEDAGTAKAKPKKGAGLDVS